MKPFFSFSYGKTDALRLSSCIHCNRGGKWKLKMGAPELRGEKAGDWKPGEEWGCTWDGEGKSDPAAHLVVLNPGLWNHDVMHTEVFIHEILHVIDHSERCRGTRGWKKSIQHVLVTRIAQALAKFFHENDIVLVKRTPTATADTQITSNGPTDAPS